MKCPRANELPSPPRGKTGWPWTENSSVDEWLSRRKEWPRVSLVMPSYNQRDFIEESLRSVLLQGYPDLEFFVYDANSPDGSAETIRKYAPWLTYWVSAPDCGQSDAINKGLRRATGKYFNWHNSDDVLTPCSIFKAANALLNHPEASCAHGYRKVIYADGSLHSSTEKAFGPPTRLAPDVGNSISALKTGAQPGGLMDRDLVLRLGGVDERLHFVMDIDIMLKLSIIRPILYVHEELIHYRFHACTKSHSGWPRERCHEKLWIVDNLYKMPESRPYAALRKASTATGHRYAAECSWTRGDKLAFFQHLLMDIICQPTGGWHRRRALFYYLRQRGKGLAMGAQVQTTVDTGNTAV